MEFNIFNLGGLNFSGLKTEFNLGGAKSNPPGLGIALRALTGTPTLLACLSWHTRASGFTGRELELQDLIAWCDHAAPISLRFVHGGAGYGKSRLAAELALGLRQKKWDAGFYPLPSGWTPPVTRVPGTLIVVDYPEEDPAALAIFLRTLTRIEATTKIRILCLARSMPPAWDKLVASSGITDIYDIRTVQLSGISEEAAYELFCGAMEHIAEVIDTCPLPVSTERFAAWFASDPSHATPLYILSAAMHAAFVPQAEPLQVDGRAAIKALVQKEQDRLGRLAEGRGFPILAYSQLMAGALLQGGMRSRDVASFAAVIGVGASIAEDDPTFAAITRCDAEDVLHVDMPDLLAACLIADTLRKSDVPHDILWHSQTLRPQPLASFARLVSDAQSVMLGDGAVIIESAIRNLDDPDRFPAYFEAIGSQREQSLEPAIWPLWTAIALKAAAQSESPLIIASSLNNAGVGLSNNGRHSEAIVQLKRARDVIRSARLDRPAKYAETSYIMVNLGRAYIGLGRDHRAITILTDCIAYAQRAMAAAQNEESVHYKEAEVLGTIALAHDNMGRAYCRLAQYPAAINAAEMACRFAELAQATSGRDPTWSEYMMALNLAVALCLSGQSEKAISILADEEIALRRVVAGAPPLKLALTLNLFHQASFALSSSELELGEESVAKWGTALEKIEEAIAGADRLFTDSPSNMGSTAIVARTMRSDIMLRLGDLDAYLQSVTDASIYMTEFKAPEATIALFACEVAFRLRRLLGDGDAKTAFERAFAAERSVAELWTKASAVTSVDELNKLKAGQVVVNGGKRVVHLTT